MIAEDEAATLTASILACEPGPAFVLDAGALGQLKDLKGVLARHDGAVSCRSR